MGSNALFDNLAPYYDQWYGTSLGKAVDYVEQKAIKDLFHPQGKAVLEVGCGTGLYTLWLAEEGYNVTGLDISQEMVKQAQVKVQKAGKKVNWILNDIHVVLDDLPSYDGILSVTAFEFIPEPEKILRLLYQKLNPGGCLVIGVIADKNPWSEFYLKSAKENPESVFRNARFFSEQEIMNWKLGVEPKMCRALFFPPDIQSFDKAMEMEEKARGNPGFLAARWQK